MEKFLEFINNAPVSEIGAALGIKSAVAKKVSAARPYDSLEALAAASGLPLEKLNELAGNDETSAALLTASEPETPQEAVAGIEEEPETAPQPEEEKPHRGKSGVVVKVLLWLLLLAAFAAGLYFGIPLFKKVILDPLQSNTTQVGELTTKQQEDVAALQKNITELQNLVGTLDARAVSAEETLAAYQATLAAQDSSIASLTSALSTARAEMNTNDNILATKAAEQQLLSRALQFLSRARLYLSQSNYGLAREDINSARTLLFSMLDTISADKEMGMRMAIERLDFALVNLPAYPVLAVYDLDIAWQLLVDDLPAAPELVVTPAVFETVPPIEPTPTAETTETPAAEVSPTPQP